MTRLAALLFFIIVITCSALSAQTGNSIILSGNTSGSYVRVPDDSSLRLTSNYTLEAWIKPTGFTALGGIISKYTLDWANRSYVLRLTSTGNYRGLNFDQMYTDDNILSANQWYHIVAVNDNGTRRLYLNGVQQTLYGTAIDVLAGTGDLCIGRDWIETNQRCFQGLIDNVRIWNIPLSATQVQQYMYSRHTGNDSHVVLQYTCEAAYTLSDSSGYGNSGLFINGASAYAEGIWTLYGLGTSTLPYTISSKEDIWSVAKNSTFWNKYFVQTGNVSFSSADFASGGAYYNSGGGWQPIGSGTPCFTGNYQGQGYTISGLYSYLPGSNIAGFFGWTANATISNLNLSNINFTGNQMTGGLIGANSGSSIISNCHVTGTVTNTSTSTGYYSGTGGIIGTATWANSQFNNLSFAGTVTGFYHVGGIAGLVNDSNSLTQCSSSGYVNLLASNGACCAGGISGAVEDAGGSIAQNAIVINKCFSSAQVAGSSTANTYGDIGGLIGVVGGAQTVTDCYANGNVMGSTVGSGSVMGVGGLFGRASSARVFRCYASGLVTGVSGTIQIGGFAGVMTSSTSGCFWDTQTSGQATSGGNATGLTSIAMKAHSTYSNAGWSFPSTWHIDESNNSPANGGYPTLAWQGMTHSYNTIITTQAATGVGDLNATLHGTILSLGTMTATGYGFCLNTGGTPTILDINVVVGTSDYTGDYAATISTLASETTYYVRAYVQDGSTIVYGGQVAFATIATPTAVTPLGSGTAAAPYLISSLGNLLWLAEQAGTNQSSGKYYQQTADIDATDTRGWYGGQGFVPIGDLRTEHEDSSFMGSYNGNGHVVTNLYINRGSSRQGFFGYLMSGASIKNLGITHAEIYGDTGVGILAGFAYSGTVSCCYTSGTVNGAVGVGGLIGVIGGGTNVNNCYSHAAVSGGDDLTGGLIGKAGGTTILHCYSTGVVLVNGVNVGSKGLIGSEYDNPNTIMNVFDTETSLQTSSLGATGLNSTQMKTRATFADMGWDVDGMWKIDSAINSGYPYLSAETIPSITTLAVSNLTYNSVTLNGQVVALGTPLPTQHGFCWGTMAYPTITDVYSSNGVLTATGSFSYALTDLIPNTTYYARAYATNSHGTAYGAVISFLTPYTPPLGSGTQANPYQISNVYNLIWVSQTHGGSAGADKYYQLTADFDASLTSNWDAGRGFIPIGDATDPFTGHFDGTDHTISNLHINRQSTDYIGLFGYTQNASIGRVKLAAATIHGNSKVGILVGYNSQSSIIWNCSAGGTVTSGVENPTVYYWGWDGSYAVGGLVGYNAAYIDNCSSTGSVYAYAEAGGMVGNNTGSITNSYSRSYVERRWLNTYRYHENYGGFVGTNTGQIAYCYSTGQVYYTNVNQNAVDYPQGLQIDNAFVGVDEDGGCLISNFFNVATSGASSSAWNSNNYGEAPQGITFGTASQMHNTLQAAEWNLDAVWGIQSGVNDGYPVLSSAVTPIVHVMPVSSINVNSAVFSARIDLTGTTVPVNYGFYYGTLAQMIHGGSRVNLGSTSSTRSFSLNCTNLLGGTTYFVSPYVSFGDIEVYGAPSIFVTLPNEPVVTTDSVVVVGSNYAGVTGTIASIGISNINHYGFCWNTTGNPTLADSYCDIAIYSITDPSTIVDPYTFTFQISGLQLNTTYYCRTYATNSGGTGYGEVKTFITLPLEPEEPYGIGCLEHPYIITSLANLYWITLHPESWSSAYEQTADIDAAQTTTWLGGGGWPPIARHDAEHPDAMFTGNYNGNGHTISNLYINWTGNGAALFASNDGGLIENLGVINANITGTYNSAGAIAGRNSGMVINCYSTGRVNGVSCVGGLVGENMSGSIQRSFSTATVSSSQSNFCGGLVGLNSTAGGSGVFDCYASGVVTNTGNAIGGLIGGSNLSSCLTSRCYSTSVVAPGTGSGFTGMNYGNNCSDCYWDTQISGTGSSAAGVGYTTAEMQTLALYTAAGWDIASYNDTSNSSSLWVYYPGHYPLLRWQLSYGAIVTGATNTTNLQFGSVQIGTQQSLSFNLTASGKIPLIGTILLPEGYSLANAQSPFSVAAGTTQTFNVVFTPTLIGNYHGTTTIYTNDLTNSPITLSVTGTGSNGTLTAPANIRASVSGNNIVLTWTAVSGATAYRVYSATAPVGTYTEDTSGSFAGTSWSAPMVGERVFFKVTAVNDTRAVPVRNSSEFSGQTVK